MLLLTRKSGESVILEAPNLEPIKITLFENGRIGFDAPEEVQIIREELLEDSTAV
ncbi:MAG: hypothetical protein BMS9Abin25_0227 [Gammaproteobacteria bacterium]|nr:MAG: hypothetical protein BMS9Abin25_0227 [Gammaproteobacteria bacterium]